MDELEITTSEIKEHMQTLGKASFKIGSLQLGNSATLKQIANHVSPQLGVPSELILKAMLSVEGGVNHE